MQSKNVYGVTVSEGKKVASCLLQIFNKTKLNGMYVFALMLEKVNELSI